MAQRPRRAHSLQSARLDALAALVLGAVALGLVAVAAWKQFPDGLIALACLLSALVAALHGVVHRGAVRVLALALALALLGAAVALLVSREWVLTVLLVLAATLSLSAANAAFRVRIALPRGPRPRRAVLFYNPRSGGGKAVHLALASEARARGIEPVELTPGTSLQALVRDAVGRGADALAMAGGDGSQAIVAAIAAERSLPYACVPAGTRNHFALDLGVDRDDVVGALDALVDGGERVVDLALVNGRVFVNNVSLGIYGEAVRRPGYRDAKLRTLLDAIPDAVGPDARAQPLRFTDPEGRRHEDRATVLVSNNRYRLGGLGAGTRPRLDDGLLGIVVARERPPERAGVLERARGLRAWTAPTFTVLADGRLPAGVDGEAVELAAPLQFTIWPRALKVLIARAHPGASPSVIEPEGLSEAIRALARIALGRAPR